GAGGRAMDCDADREFRTGPASETRCVHRVLEDDPSALHLPGDQGRRADERTGKHALSRQHADAATRSSTASLKPTWCSVPRSRVSTRSMGRVCPWQGSNPRNWRPSWSKDVESCSGRASSIARRKSWTCHGPYRQGPTG